MMRLAITGASFNALKLVRVIFRNLHRRRTHCSFLEWTQPNASTFSSVPSFPVSVVLEELEGLGGAIQNVGLRYKKRQCC